MGARVGVGAEAVFLVARRVSSSFLGRQEGAESLGNPETGCLNILYVCVCVGGWVDA